MQSTSVNRVKENEIKWSIFFGLSVLFLLLTVLPGQANADVVNINKANAEALQQNLVGIGPVKAKAIIQYRKKNGPFKSTDDLAKVPGIGSEIMKKNRRNVSINRGLVKADSNTSKGKTSKENEKAKSQKKAKDKKDKLDKKMAKKDKADKKMKKDKKSKKSTSSKSKKNQELVKKQKQSKSKNKVKKAKKPKKSKKLKEKKSKKSK